MLKWICAVALLAAASGEAQAQKTKLPDRPLKKITDFDPAPIKEGLGVLKQGGECTVNYIVAASGKAKDITADCSVPDMAPYVVRTVQGAEWEAEIVDHEFFDSYPQRQIFKFGTVANAAPDPRGEKAPILVTGVEPKDVERAIARTEQEGTCAVKFTVGADGKPKDIVPNCTSPALDPHISEAVAKMRFTPAQKDGAPTDWPGMSMPMNLAKPERPKE
jgi:hypothetical protein